MRGGADGQSAVIISRDNFVGAETDFHFAQTLGAGGFGRLLHAQIMGPIAA
jgi:hypothetical protein